MSAETAHRRHGLKAIALAGGLALSTLARAQAIPGYPASIDAFDPREVALLPRFCTYTQQFRERVPGGNDPVLIQRWMAQLGPEYHHLHHYCYGLMKTNRAVLLARDPRSRLFYLNDAITEFDYVITRSAEDFVLLPEVLTKKGENLVLLGKAPMAVLEFERAIALNKAYWPPYAQLSDHYSKAGDKAKARETLEAGLSHVPDARALKRRLRDIDSAADRSSARR